MEALEQAAVLAEGAGFGREAVMERDSGAEVERKPFGVFGSEFFGLVAHSDFEEEFLAGLIAANAPSIVRELIDEFALDGVDGGEAVEEFTAERVEFGLFFGGEHRRTLGV